MADDRAPPGLVLAALGAAFQAGASRLGAEFGSLAGRRLATVSAHDVLQDVGPVLLVLAGISLLASASGPRGPLTQ
jgi:hypothetical protein